MEPNPIDKQAALLLPHNFHTRNQPPNYLSTSKHNDASEQASNTEQTKAVMEASKFVYEYVNSNVKLAKQIQIKRWWIFATVSASCFLLTLVVAFISIIVYYVCFHGVYIALDQLQYASTPSRIDKTFSLLISWQIFNPTTQPLYLEKFSFQLQIADTKLTTFYNIDSVIEKIRPTNFGNETLYEPIWDPILPQSQTNVQFKQVISLQSLESKVFEEVFALVFNGKSALKVEGSVQYRVSNSVFCFTLSVEKLQQY